MRGRAGAAPPDAGTGAPGRLPTARLRTVLPVAFAAALLAPALGAQSTGVEAGNARYRDGDFAGAIEAYEAVLDQGWEAPDLHYNLGNAYWKAGRVGPAILAWERARTLDPGDPDVAANLELARSRIRDDIEPLPEFWAVQVARWWVDLLPRPLLLTALAAAWVTFGVGLALRILARGAAARRSASVVALAAGLVVLLLGLNAGIRELGWGRAQRAVVLADVAAAHSAPTRDDDLVLFEIHEGTTVTVEQRTDRWAEVVLPDGKVGWVEIGALGFVQREGPGVPP